MIRDLLASILPHDTIRRLAIRIEVSENHEAKQHDMSVRAAAHGL